MGFLSRLFRFARRNTADMREDDWEEIVLDHGDVDFSDAEQRTRYITNCMEQIADASREVNQLNGEYALVTAYLTDMEEIEALPQTPRQELNRVARAIDDNKGNIRCEKDEAISDDTLLENMNWLVRGVEVLE